MLETLDVGIKLATLIVLILTAVVLPSIFKIVKFVKEMRDLMESLGNRVTAIETRNKYADLFHTTTQEELKFLRAVILKEHEDNS